ncbi:Na+/H+ antiporter [Planococcus dechangensis]|uniref:Na+/H+ antiporter n=1 Tax=Planococcus dechangensis TaxID=1176255 RepID=A0ABV9MHQ0_9BACL
MELLLTIMVLLVALLVSNVVSHYVPQVPTALIQVALGIIIVLVFEDFTFQLEAEWFLLLFIAPLLFNDGRHFPREELWRMRGPIFGNAVILVLLTTAIGGYFIHWLIEDIPLAAAFALAAILSPTDPVAVNGISQRIRIPPNVLSLVRGESLINDASGLVAFNYAVAAVVTGSFSLYAAFFNFSYKFLAGAFIGIALALVFVGIRLLFRKQGINDVTFHSLLQIMTPFVIFVIAEEFLGASGVIAVVVGGIVHALVQEETEALVAEEQMLTENIWTIITFILNGIIFLLLGLNVPGAMSGALENPNTDEGVLLSYVVAITAMLLGIRFVWAYLFSQYEYRFGKMADSAKPSLKLTLFVSLTGVRGTVTMVGILSLPLVIDGGFSFPQRPLLLFLAAGTILLTLLLATVFLPLLSKGKMAGSEEGGNIDLEEARRRILLASIARIKAEMNETNETAAYELMDEYRLRFQQVQPEGEEAKEANKKYQRRMKEVRLRALRAERRYIQRLKKTQGMDREVYAAFEHSLDRREEAIAHNARSTLLYLQGKLIRAWRRFRGENWQEEEIRLVEYQVGREVQLNALEAAVEDMKAHYQKASRKDVVDAVMTDYRKMISRLRKPETLYDERYEMQKEELRINVMDMGRAKIYDMYDAGEITRHQAKELRKYINYIESVTLYDPTE